MRSERRKISTIFTEFVCGHIQIFVLVCALLISGIGTVLYNSNDHEVTLVVTDKERIHSNSKKDYYLIYGTDDTGETTVLKISDLLIKGKFNSSDLYQQLEEGKTYTVSVSGHRIRIFSEYPNINKILITAD